MVKMANTVFCTRYYSKKKVSIFKKEHANTENE